MSLSVSLEAFPWQADKAKVPRNCRILLLPKQLLALQQLSMLFPNSFKQIMGAVDSPV